MHEYRLDWLPGKTVFYLDGVVQQVYTEDVPTVPGEWMWNNWRYALRPCCLHGYECEWRGLIGNGYSNGDQGWSAGPPASDNVFKIGRIEMYYNRTGDAGSC